MTSLYSNASRIMAIAAHVFSRCRILGHPSPKCLSYSFLGPQALKHMLLVPVPSSVSTGLSVHGGLMS